MPSFFVAIIPLFCVFGVYMIIYGFGEDSGEKGFAVIVVGIVLIALSVVSLSVIISFNFTEKTIKTFTYTEKLGDTGQSDKCYKLDDKSYCVIDENIYGDEIIREVHSYCENEDYCEKTNNKKEVNTTQKNSIYIYKKDGNLFESNECLNFDDEYYCRDNENNLVIVEKYNLMDN